MTKTTKYSQENRPGYFARHPFIGLIGSLVYLIVPFDFLPEAIFGFVGLFDDAAIGLFAVQQLFVHQAYGLRLLFRGLLSVAYLIALVALSMYIGYAYSDFAYAYLEQLPPTAFGYEIPAVDSTDYIPDVFEEWYNSGQSVVQEKQKSIDAYIYAKLITGGVVFISGLLLLGVIRTFLKKVLKLNWR